MAVFFAVPFVALSLLMLVVCLTVRRWRRHVLSAALAPFGFAIASVIGAALIIGGAFQYFSSGQGVTPLQSQALLFFGFVLPGVAGALAGWKVGALVTARAASVRRLLKIS